MDRIQLGTAIIAFSLLMIISPWGISKVPNIGTSEYIGGLTALVIFYSIVFFVAGLAVYFVKEKEEVVSVAQ